MSGDSSAHAVGDAIDGYTLGERISERVGAVTHAARGSEDIDVHITLYSPDCFPSALVRERSLRELRQLMTIAAPRMVRVVGAGKLDDGGIYEVTEPVEGPSLAANPAPRGAEEIAAIINGVGEALLEAQKLGVIHRNLAAHVIHEGPSGIKVGAFAVGEPLGERSYGPPTTIAPEQVAGKVVDQRALIYNLAALIVELGKGAPLFAGTVEEVLSQHLETAPPAGLAVVLERALAKDPRKRPMMLKQFLVDVLGPDGLAIASAVPQGAAATPPTSSASPAGQAPSSPTTRGWTQFMEANESAQEDEPQAGMTPTLAGTGPVQKPTTRGWTMFMDAEEADGGDAAEQQAPVTPAAQESVPSTRGWTQFMEGEDGSLEASEAPASTGPDAPTRPEPQGQVQVPSPASAANPAAPAPAATEAKPSTRGWTQFMDDDEVEAPAAAASAPQVPVAAATPPVAEPEAPLAAAPSSTGLSAGPAPGLGEGGLGGAAPRWTEKPGFADRLNEPAEAGSVASNPGPGDEASAVAAELARAQAAGADSNGASNTARREWTAYEEPRTPAPAETGAEAAEATGESEDERETRGWTAFMEAELPPNVPRIEERAADTAEADSADDEPSSAAEGGEKDPRLGQTMLGMAAPAGATPFAPAEDPPAHSYPATEMAVSEVAARTASPAEVSAAPVAGGDAPQAAAAARAASAPPKLAELAIDLITGPNGKIVLAACGFAAVIVVVALVLVLI